MKHIEINIGNACNMKCLFCMSVYNSDLPKLVIDKQVYEKLLINKQNGYNSVGFIGGEPTIHPSFLKFVSFAKKLGYQNISVVTNGFKFSRLDFFEKFILNGGNNIKFSFHCYDNTSGKLITGISRIFNLKVKVLENYKLLKQKYVFISMELQTVINKINYLHLGKILKLASLYRIPIRLQYLGYYYDYPFENLKHVFIELEKVVEVLYDLYLEFKDYFISGRFTVSDIPICYLKRYFNIYLILKFLGDRYDYIDDIEDIRNKERFSFKKRKHENIKYYPLLQCKKCKFLDICPGFYKGYFEVLKKINQK